MPGPDASRPQLNRAMSSLEWSMLLGLSVLWGGSFFFVGIALQELPLFTIVVLRVALAAGRFALGGWLYLFAGILDVLDGRIARARGLASKKGAALDSVLDRYSDSAVLVGLSWYYRDSWVLLAAQLAYGFRERPGVRYGLTALCIGMGMGAAILWERVDG